ncbi:hypothetical protein [Winogradskyella aurantiaca]|uniref:hypothetical protein n=1 Tax=Winogradskyella aurantiaca TaxID=2219558 RepID=UPI000E1D8617|nr:hypothetical protein [Winogradskyella aurantiaca]
MKKLIIPVFAVLLLTLTGCSSVKVLDAWKSDNITDMKSNKFLIVARTENKQARIALENEIVDVMTASGYNAEASFTSFTSFSPDDKSDQDSAKLQQLLDSKGYNGVVLTAVKDYREEQRTTTSGGYYAGGSYMGYYPRYYGGFYDYYYHPYAYSSYGTYVPSSSTTSIAQIYVLETTIYDLTKSGDEQLVAVVTSELDNPSNVSNVSKDLVKKIGKALD